MLGLTASANSYYPLDGLIYFTNKNSIDFDGVDDRIVTDGADTVAQNSTYSFWCKSSTTSNNLGVFGHGGQQIGAFHFNASSNRPLLWYNSGFFRYWVANDEQDDGEWHHWVVYADTNDMTNSKLYIDGILQATATTSNTGGATAFTESLTIGSDQAVGGNSFQGKIDEFAVFDRELTQAEITRMYNSYYTTNLVSNGTFEQIGLEEVTNGDFSQIGSEEITNGDFATDSDWVKGTGWSIANSKATQDGTGSGSSLQQSNILVVGKRYKVKFEILERTQGSLEVFAGFPNSNVPSVNTVGTHTFYLLAEGLIPDLYFRPSNFIGSIDNVSVKEITGADMDVTRETAATRVDEDGLVNYAEIIGDELVTCGDFSCATPSTYWTATNAVVSFSNNQITVDDTASAGGDSRATQNFPTISGRVYRVKINRISTTTTFWLSIGNGSSFNNIKYLNLGTDTGEYTTEFTATGLSSTIALQVGGSGVSVFSDVTVKEVTRDNVPRIDYTGGGCPHILSEPERTNLVTYSEDFSEWTTEGSIEATDNFITSPDGTQNATKLQLTGSSSGTDGKISFAVSPSATTHTFSVFAKKGNHDYIYIWINMTVGSNITRWINLDDGSVNVGSGTATVTTTSFSNDWWKIEYTFDATNMSKIKLEVADDGGSTGTGGDNIYVWGAQLEEGSYGTSYIPTSGSTVTRNQDIFTRDGIGSLINSTEGVLFLEMAALSDDGTNRYISINDGSTQNYVYFRFMSTSNRVLTRTVVAGVTINTLQITISDTTAFNKYAIKWKSGDYAFWINGVEVGTDSSSTIFSADVLNQIDFDFPTASGNFPSKVKQLQVYNTALTDEQLLQLTGTSGTDFYESYAEMASALTYTIQ